MHFNDYDSAEYITKYFQVLNYVINQDIFINIVIVNNKDAAKLATKMSLDTSELRDLFYAKIPERLFYGLTRDLNQIQEVRIKIDEATDYKALDLYTTLKDQMNAHSAYRHKGYKVSSVLGKNSKFSIPLQIIDVFLGIVVFLMEESYYDDTVSSRSKSDLIYRFLIEGDNIEKFQKQISLYKWEGNDGNLVSIPISEYISKFLVYKTKHDMAEMAKLQKIILNSSQTQMSFLQKIRTYQQNMGYSNREWNTLLGYLAELELGDRNFYIRPVEFMISKPKHRILQEDEAHILHQFKSFSERRFKNVLRLGKVEKVTNIGNGSVFYEERSGYIDYEYDLQNKKYSHFKALIQPDVYWKDKRTTICGFVKIYLNDQLVYDSKDILSDLNEPKEILLDLRNASKFRIEASGKMLGIINPIFIPEIF